MRKCARRRGSAAEAARAPAGRQSPGLNRLGVIVDCAQYRDGRRQHEGPIPLERAADGAKGADEFVWIGLHEPAEEELKNKILGNMSERGAQMLREDMEALGPIKIREVERAQQQIIAIIRTLESEGVLSLKGAVGEQYVV